jgi:hypothetical protein
MAGSRKWISGELEVAGKISRRRNVRNANPGAAGEAGGPLKRA